MREKALEFRVFMVYSKSTWKTKCLSEGEALTISLAGVIDSGKVFVADTLVGTLSVVADVGTHTKLLALVLICETPQGHMKHITTSRFKSTLPPQHVITHTYLKHVEYVKENCTSTAVTSIGLEAWFAGAERVGAVHHAMSFISISTHCPVTAAVIQHRVCRHRNRWYKTRCIQKDNHHFIKTFTLRHNTPFLLQLISSEP